MDNTSLNDSFVLTMQIFDIPSFGKYPAFLLGISVYLFSVLCNLTILVVIAVERRLHTPMYIILFSLPLNDLIGITSVAPQVLLSILTERNVTYYPLCVFQAFLTHMYGGAVLLILTAMAFDRYIAICNPLRYNTIMTTHTVIKLIALVWGFDFILISTLFVLLLRLPTCRNNISNVFCDNPSLLKLTCAATVVNNIYGLFITAVLQVISISAVVYTYVKILLACLVKRQADARSKAINTCVSHLLVFVLFQFVSAFTILSYRFENISSNLRKITFMSLMLFPPLLNPLIYGLKTKEIRNTLIKVFKTRVSIK
ncbi:olfactory receptor 52E4-like [Polyodon spathula]|uniref:olfactory receptor 52E4-like n=1 Tax=Polyodon spathula TaxID=7913 RepID=UPI001B7D9CE3|nr:olfactory receptor 52E4-like [Polyodon spathula]